MNHTTRFALSALLALLILAGAAPVHAGTDSGVRLEFLAAMAVQPEISVELLIQAYRRAEDLKQRVKAELTMALKERDRGNRKGMEFHLKKAADLGSKEARALLDVMKAANTQVK